MPKLCVSAIRPFEEQAASLIFDCSVEHFLERRIRLFCHLPETQVRCRTDTDSCGHTILYTLMYSEVQWKMWRRILTSNFRPLFASRPSRVIHTSSSCDVVAGVSPARNHKEWLQPARLPLQLHDEVRQALRFREEMHALVQKNLHAGASRALSERSKTRQAISRVTDGKHSRNSSSV